MIKKRKFSCVRGGLTIRGYEYRGEGDSLPIAVVSHGFMANLDTVKHYARLLAELGYAAFCFDFCGGSVAFGRSDGATTDMSVLTEVEDLRAVIEYAKSLEYTNSRSILLMGCSQGGFVSALTAASCGEEIKKLVLFYPAFCIPDDAARGSLMFAKFDPTDPPDIIKCGPMRLGKKYVTDLNGIDPYEQICPYRGDVLIVHGTADGIVDISYSERARDLYRSDSRDRTVEYYPIERAHHVFSKRKDKIAIEHLIAFARIDKA